MYCGERIEGKRRFWSETANVVGAYIPFVLMAADLPGTDPNTLDFAKLGASLCNVLHQAAHGGPEAGYASGAAIVMEEWLEMAKHGFIEAMQANPGSKFSADEEAQYKAAAREMVRNPLPFESFAAFPESPRPLSPPG
jgi:hypothetical protein